MNRKITDRVGPLVWSRRSVLLAGATLAAWPVLGRPASAFALRRVKYASSPFTLGVASGDPSPDGFVLWTRLALAPTSDDSLPRENIEVGWEVAHDEQMQRPVAHGTSVATPEMAHSVHVEVTGLDPDRWYFYRFTSGDETSPVGRVRTAPAADAMPGRLRFAFASCQHYEHGYYTAYEHMAKSDLDLVAHLGDYIYEYGINTNKVRQHDGPEIMTLADYRNRYGLYKSDAHLQAAHAMCPWLVTWDDHEFDNNCAGAISEEAGVSPEEFLQRRAAAYQAYYEHQPLRRGALPVGPHMQLYRRVPFGRLAQFSVLDTRQYRSDQPCGDGRKPPCEGVFDPQATMLGDAQEAWLEAGLASSPARWNVLAQQVMMARVDRVPGDEVAWSMDQWSGYDVPRRRLLSSLSERGVSNPVVLTGDIHSNWANELKVDFDDPRAPVVATEFVCTSISSGGDGKAKSSDTDGILAENPFVKFQNGERGYVECDVTPSRWLTHFQVVPYVTRPGAPLLTRASFVVEDGQPGLKDA